MANVLCLVSYKIFPAKLGGQKGVAFFYKFLSAFHTITCATVKDNDPRFAEYEVLNILSNSKLRYINIFYFFTLRRIIRQKNISHLIMEHPYYGWLGILLQIFCRVKLVIHSHNIEAYRFRSIGKWWWGILWHYEKFIHQSANHSFCINEADRQFMISQFKLNPSHCTVVTYGIEWDKPPAKPERLEAKRFLCSKYLIAENTTIYLFNGTLNYLPNLDAVKTIINEINPILLSAEFIYKIIICGKNLPPEMNELKAYSNKNIIYAGFVDDISIYFKGADVFINPVTDGGGIKTKLVEALGYDLNAVSTIIGATGIDTNLCNGKLLLSHHDNWNIFAGNMMAAIKINAEIPSKYFEHFYWGNIAEKAARELDAGC